MTEEVTETHSAAAEKVESAEPPPRRWRASPRRGCSLRRRTINVRIAEQAAEAEKKRRLAEEADKARFAEQATKADRLARKKAEAERMATAAKEATTEKLSTVAEDATTDTSMDCSSFG